MLGTGKEIIDRYVNSGEVQIVFWPVIDHGAASLNATAAAFCAGEQDPDAFWTLHDLFFENQRQLFNADRGLFVDAAVGAGLDQATFESCYDAGTTHTAVTQLDEVRRENGIRSRPSFDIAGQLIVGAQPFSVFEEAIEAALPAE